MTILKKDNAIPLVIITVVFFIFASYTFNSKVDLNGDNCVYYAMAQSIATQGRVALKYTPGNPLTSVFSPGFPILMAPIIWISNSFTLQNAYGEFFLWIIAVTLYLLGRQLKLKKGLALLLSLSCLFNYLILKFSTMTMSYIPTACFSVLGLYLLVLDEDRDKPSPISMLFIISVILISYSNLIHPSGIITILSLFGYLLFAKKTKKLIASIIICVMVNLPWYVRNSFYHLGNRYASAILYNTGWYNKTSVWAYSQHFIYRTFINLFDYIGKSIPQFIFPFISVDYSETGSSYYITGIFIMAVILYACWQIKKYRYFFIFYIIGNILLISSLSDSILSAHALIDTRYLSPWAPLIVFLFYFGCIHLFERYSKKTISHPAIWAILIVFVFVIQYSSINQLNQENNQDYPPAYQNFVDLSSYTIGNFPDSTIFCIRKPELFYVFSQHLAVQYLNTDSTQLLIGNLIDQHVDYVILDQLGYSSTPKYLWPAIQKYSSCFVPVYQTSEPIFYLLKFNRLKADSLLHLRL